VSVSPNLQEYKPIRQVGNLGVVLSDVESHMPPGHIYSDSDKITWAHETTHGINSRLRQQTYSTGSVLVYKRMETLAQEKNALYVLNNRYAVILEPNTTIRQVSGLVPPSLRGGVYNLYLVQSTGSWNNQPLYLFDEWVSYSNGAACRKDLEIQSRAETVQYMLEFNVYCICVAMATNSTDNQFKTFLQWHLERSMCIYKKNQGLGDLSRSDNYLNIMRTSQDADRFRNFTRQYFGENWTKTTLGF
jgi:hypothetical protein